jgi:hypothetical protein
LNKECCAIVPGLIYRSSWFLYFVSSPIALLAALPGETLKAYFHTMAFPVRSATHHVIGLTEEVPPRNVVNPCDLRRLVVQSLLSAALANESEFGQGPPPMVPIRCVLNLFWYLSSRITYLS